MTDAYFGRRTTYKGVRMRSRLEAATAAAFDRHGIPWEYEPEALQGADRQYLPDFTVIADVAGIYPTDPEAEPDLRWTHDQLFYVEVKPTREMQIEAVRTERLRPVIDAGGLGLVLVPTLAECIVVGPSRPDGVLMATHQCRRCPYWFRGSPERAMEAEGVYPACWRCETDRWPLFDHPLLAAEYWKPTA